MGQSTEALYLAGICCGGLVLSWLLGLVLIHFENKKSQQLWDLANGLERERARSRASAQLAPTTEPTWLNPPECPACGSPLKLEEGPLYDSRLLLCPGPDCNWAQRLQVTGLPDDEPQAKQSTGPAPLSRPDRIETRGPQMSASEEPS